MMQIDVAGQGGPVLWLIGFIGAIALILFLQRLFHLHRAQIKTDDFIRGIFNIVNKGNIVEAVSQCEETPGPVAQMMRMAILEREQGPERVRQAMQDLGIDEARANGSTLALTALVDQFYAEVQALGGRRWDTSSLAARLERD